MGKSIEQLRKEYAEADARVKGLAVEVRELPERIEAAARQEARGKARAAREGGDVATLQASELPDLRARQEALPYEVWGARVNRAEIGLELQKAELELAVKERQEANAEREAAEAAYQEAKAAFEVAQNRHYSAAAREQDLRAQIKQASRDLANLEAEGPRHIA